MVEIASAFCRLQTGEAAAKKKKRANSGVWEEIERLREKLGGGRARDAQNQVRLVSARTQRLHVRNRRGRTRPGSHSGAPAPCVRSANVQLCGQGDTSLIHLVCQNGFTHELKDPGSGWVCPHQLTSVQEVHLARHLAFLFVAAPAEAQRLCRQESHVGRSAEAGVLPSKRRENQGLQEIDKQLLLLI